MARHNPNRTNAVGCCVTPAVVDVSEKSLKPNRNNRSFKFLESYFFGHQIPNGMEALNAPIVRNPSVVLLNKFESSVVCFR